jgi:uncharacterized protein YgbK (DUF1537 family)
MTSMMSWDEVGVAPSEARVVADARATIRRSNFAARRRLLVLDDDPTGSQAVHGVEVVTTFDVETIERALAEPGSTCFVLTNSRSLDPDAAGSLAERLGRLADELERRLGGTIEVISRSDSTLRGHVLEETHALDVARRAATGRGYDAVIFAPSFLEAGRFTAGDIHWTRRGAEVLPVGETDYARDASFGFANSNLREFLAEKSGGRLSADGIVSISLEDIRVGGPDRVAAVLAKVHDATFVVINAVAYADLEVVVLGVAQAEAHGARFLFRTGPSLVQVLAGLDPAPPLTAADIWPVARPERHGIVVVGSHVELTNDQVESLLDGTPIATVQLDVARVLDAGGNEVIAQCVAECRLALARDDVLLITSRAVRVGTDKAESLDLARRVSSAVVAVVRSLLDERPAWIVAKGGITAHDVLTHGLGVRRAEVLGQLFPGAVSVFRPLEASGEAVGLPCVVFPGNVGDSRALLEVVTTLRGAR